MVVGCWGEDMGLVVVLGKGGCGAKTVVAMIQWC